MVTPGHHPTREPVGSSPTQRWRAALRRSTGQLSLAVLAVGLAGGAAGAAYVTLLHRMTDVLGPEHHGTLATAAVLVTVGASVALLTRVSGPSGDVELLVDNIHVLGGADDARRLRTLLPASLLCVSAGGAMGPEAPLVQTTGTVGTWVGQRLGRDRTDVRVLTITGMAAGFTVLFGAPLGAALFALEILHRRGLQYYEAIVPALVGSLCGYGIFVALTGSGLEPVWSFPTPGPLHLQDLLVAVGVGLAGALGAVAFSLLAAGGRRLADRVPWWCVAPLGGALLGLLGWWSPYALTFGEAQLAALLDNHLAAGALVVAVVAKLAGTTVTLASGWKGGFIIPLFFMGAALGQLGHLAVPGVSESVLMATAMVALCVGVTKTPLGSTLVVTEMAGLPLLPVTLVAAVVALAASGTMGPITSQRSRSDLADEGAS